MTVGDFAEAVAKWARDRGGSCTSWGRSPERNRKVGGAPRSSHADWLGADIVYDTGPNAPGSADHQKYTRATPRSCPQCNGTLGLKVLHESDHDHLQPMDWRP